MQGAVVAVDGNAELVGVYFSQCRYVVRHLALSDKRPNLVQNVIQEVFHGRPQYNGWIKAG
ncbi:hypothetical protein GCM10007392_47750 [Saccharospirillum salsuginis]|uniref:Uncharacterized protein n=1 Tax=Saccharospirillum salsuginis TaxID=418750 RepID=A0A918KUP9_9GAMM|nr:hypothetical protein GCM10007392_47750 [Saccharospirillum salsuginis]